MILGGAVAYWYFISGLSTNPPGFYLDESGGAYNAYLIATTGRGEFGTWFPLYFQFYTESNIQYSNPVHIYLMAQMYLFAPPSTLSARIFCATLMFIATILLGVLATRISGRRSIGIIIALTAMATPWIFEPSRLVLEASVYPLALSMFLLFVYNAFHRDEWRWADSVFIGLTLGVLTYAYTIGRFLGPVLGFGLLMLVKNWRQLLGVIKTGIVYTISLVPFLWVYFSNNAAVTGRFNSVTWVDMSQPWSVLWDRFYDAYSTDISLKFLLDEGDPLTRHHIPGSGELLAATFAVAMVGIVVILFRHWRQRWWWFLIYGLLLGIVPGALTVQRFHSLRTIAFPVFLLLLTVPAMMSLLGPPKADKQTYDTFADWLDALPARFIDAIVEWRRMIFNRRLLGAIILTVILILTFNQADDFQTRFRDIGPTRGSVYDQAYLPTLEEALAQPDRPIYLEDGFWGPAYIHAYWYATTLGVSLSNFIHLAEREKPPLGSVVLSSNNSCDNCEVLSRRGSYLLYRTSERPGMTDVSTLTPTPPVQPAPAPTAVPNELPKPTIIGLDMKTPRGIAVDDAGTIYMADTGNSRVVKLSAKGEVLTLIGPGSGGELSEPTGVALNSAGDVYVVDATRKSLLKFHPDGTFIRQWNGAETGFGALSDIAICGDKLLYLADRERGRIVKFDPDTGAKTEWGKAGEGEGEFKILSGIACTEKNVYVADTQNDRIEVFDTAGNFVRQWSVDQWGKYIWNHPDVAVDESKDLVFVTNGWLHQVLMFDLNGALIQSLESTPDVRVNNPSAIVFSDTKRGRYLYLLNTAKDAVDTGPPSIFVFDLSKSKK